MSILSGFLCSNKRSNLDSLYFISHRRQRATIAARDAEADAASEAQKRAEEEAEARRKDSHLLAVESIKRELAESEFQHFI